MWVDVCMDVGGCVDGCGWMCAGVGVDVGGCVDGCGWMWVDVGVIGSRQCLQVMW